VKNVWRQCPSGRLESGNFIKDKNGDGEYNITNQFFEYEEEEPLPPGGLIQRILYYYRTRRNQ
jgi:hypothetical protein